MRIQFDLSADLWNRLSRYVSNEKMRHYIAEQALEEWVNRREGRDKKLQTEQLVTNKEILRPIVDELLRRPHD